MQRQAKIGEKKEKEKECTKSVKVEFRHSSLMEGAHRQRHTDSVQSVSEAGKRERERKRLKRTSNGNRFSG